MKQVIVYKPNIDVFVLYRGGYSKELREGLDPYNRFNISDIQSAIKGNIKSPICNGYILYTNKGYYSDITSRSEDLIKFFGFDKDSKEEQMVEMDLKLCFDVNGRHIFYKQETPDPKKIYKKVKTRCNFFRNWYNSWDWFRNNGPWDVYGYKLSDDYIVVYGDIKFLQYQLLPEYKDLPIKYKYTGYEFEDLYNIQPISLSSSYDYTPEEKSMIEKGKKEMEEAMRKQELELEHLRSLPGYCDCCGSPGASWVADPFDEEICGIINYRWLCSRCYNDSAGDI